MQLTAISTQDLVQLINKIDDINDKLEKVLSSTKNANAWLGNEEVSKLLKVTPRTLQNYRDKGILPFSQVGSKIYYKAADIQAHLEDHYVKPTVNGRRGE